eukprot:Skav233207  [mRNA]  locus=scaffold1872:48079:49767:- [translate_table: standard]
MSGFGALSASTLEVMSRLMDECTYHVVPDLVSWSGQRVIQVEVSHVQMHDEALTIQGWLIDNGLPKSIFAMNKLYHDVPPGTRRRICQCEVLVPFMLPHHISEGDTVVAQVHLDGSKGVRTAKVLSNQAFWLVSNFDPSKPVKFVHLFCGAFHGWAQAALFLENRCLLFRSEHSISVDWDGNVCSTTANTHNAQLILPPWNEVFRRLHRDVVIACDVKNPIWTCAIQHAMNVIWTASFPCPPYSKAKGRGPGLESCDGQSLLHVLAIAKKAQPCMILLENVDSFIDHPHARLVFLFAKWAGYRVVWMQKHDLGPLTNATRFRWLAAMVRMDISDELFEHVFQPEAYCDDFVPWHHVRNQFPLPSNLSDQLKLDEALIDIYGDPAFLPQSKRSIDHLTVHDVLTSRVSKQDQPLATLVACYSKQHQLPENTLRSKGLFAELACVEGSFQFHSPPTWATLLGNLHSLMMPESIESMFQQLGNAIATPHAAMVLLAAFRATGILDNSIHLDKLVAECWKDRLDASTAICAQTSKGFAILTPGDFLLTCPVDRIKMLSMHHQFDGQ